MAGGKNSKSWFWKVLGCIAVVVSLYLSMKGLEKIFVTKEVHAIDYKAMDERHEFQLAGVLKSVNRVNLNSEVVFYMQVLPIKRAEEQEAKKAYERQSSNPVLRQEWLNKTKERMKAEDDLKRAEEQRRKCQ